MNERVAALSHRAQRCRWCGQYQCVIGGCYQGAEPADGLRRSRPAADNASQMLVCNSGFMTSIEMRGSARVCGIALIEPRAVIDIDLQ